MRIKFTQNALSRLRWKGIRNKRKYRFSHGNQQSGRRNIIALSIFGHVTTLCSKIRHRESPFGLTRRPKFPLCVQKSVAFFVKASVKSSCFRHRETFCFLTRVPAAKPLLCNVVRSSFLDRCWLLAFGFSARVHGVYARPRWRK